MDKKNLLNFIFIIVIGLLTIYIASLFYSSEFFTNFLNESQNNLYIFLLVVLFLKFLAIVYPPLPGAVFTLSLIPLIGWPAAYLVDFLGATLGAGVSYTLAQKYGYRIINKVFPPEIAKRIKKTNIRKDKQIESMIVLRVLTGGTIIEAVNYAAPILNVRFDKFLIGTVISHPIFGIPVFFTAGTILTGGNILYGVPLLILLLLVLYKFRGRYLE